MSGWANPDHVDTLKRLRTEGQSASEIAVSLNRIYRDAAYSREAVCGKLWRLGMGHDVPSSPRRAPSVSRNTRAANGLNTKGAAKVKEPLVFAAPGSPFGSGPKPPLVMKARTFDPLPGSNPRPWTERRRFECSWPVGEGEGPDLLHCCLPANGRWCPTHEERGLTQRSPSERKKSLNDEMRALRRHIA